MHQCATALSIDLHLFARFRVNCSRNSLIVKKILKQLIVSALSVVAVSGIINAWDDRRKPVNGRESMCKTFFVTLEYRFQGGKKKKKIVTKIGGDWSK